MTNDEWNTLQPGMRVKMSPEGRSWLHPRAGVPSTGKIARLSSRPSMIAVRKDGLKTIEVYHRTFWDLELS